MAMAPAAAQAADPVTNTNDSGPGSLRNALGTANSGDTIVVPAGSYQLTGGELAITTNLTLSGAGAASTVITRASKANFRILHVTSGRVPGPVVISGLTIRGGNAAPYASGGGILNEGDGLLTVRNSTVTANNAEASDNIVDHGGGGIYSIGAGGLTVVTSVISENTVNEFSGTASGGGGIYNRGGPLTIQKNTVVSGNRVTGEMAATGGGGGIYAGVGGVSILDSRVTGNAVDVTSPGGLRGGGGIYTRTPLSVDKSTVADNTASITAQSGSNGGGGIRAGVGLDISESTISGNSASIFGPTREGGGGVLYAGRLAQIANSTLSGNTLTLVGSPTISGGAGYHGTSGADTFTNVTVAGNSSSGPGGGIFAERISVATGLERTILAENTASTGANCFSPAGPASAFTSAGGNVESAITCNLTQPTDKPNTNPQLGPLADNGGPTQTRALPATSPAIDTGPPGCPPTDQRGISRQGACDSGAYEFIDSTAPDTTITSGPPGTTGDSTPTFEFTSTEGGSSFQCRVDNATFAACTSPHTTPALTDGSHTFQVRATDAVGNVDQSPASRPFTVDTTAPDTTITAAPSDPTNDPTPTFSFTAEAGATFQCRVDAAAFAPCTSPHTTAALTDGSHTFEVRASDAMGNVDQSPASRTFIVDTGAPDATVTSGPSGPTSDSTPTFEFTSEAGATFQCRVDATAFAACTSPHTTAALADGAHTLQVRAIDAAGNIDATPASRTFTVDTAPPETNITAGPSGVIQDPTPSFSFGSGEQGVTFECRLDGGAFFACTSPHTTAELADGPHTFEVRAIDAAGNVDPSPAAAFGGDARRSFTVERALPPTVLGESFTLLPPVIGKTFNVEPVSGDVFVSLPAGVARASGSVPGLKGRRFIPLSEARQVPIGSLLDTRRGTVRVVSALDRAGKTQAGQFAAGVFQVLQSRKHAAKGLTELRLKGSSFAGCTARRGRRSGSGAQVSASRRIRRLRANARGRFRTRGRHSAATVRGTKWTTTDRCDGTLTQVTRGSVTVRDFRRKKNIVVKAGKRYLARARR